LFRRSAYACIRRENRYFIHFVERLSRVGVILSLSTPWMPLSIALKEERIFI
jgi:hypothetical protein